MKLLKNFIQKVFVYEWNTPTRFNNWFQIRLKEPMGLKECPYLYRWTLIICGFSIRLHHWIKSDDDRFFHDHGCNFISIILKGNYTNVTPDGEFPVKAGSMWKSDALARHYLRIPKGGAWTILICGRQYHKWGFYVPRKDNGKIRKMRPLRYFYRYGVAQTEDYQ